MRSYGKIVRAAGPFISDCTISSRKARLDTYLCKVEKILKGGLDLIPSPSPSVKIEILGGKVCLRCSKGKTLLDIVNKLLKTNS